MLTCTCGYVYVYVWITELLQHVMVLLDNYNTSGEGSRKRSVLYPIYTTQKIMEGIWSCARFLKPIWVHTNIPPLDTQQTP